MRKRLITAVLITFLSFAPAYAGHSVAGDRWCPCDTPESCTELNMQGEDDVQKITHDDAIPETELGLLDVILLLLKARA